MCCAYEYVYVCTPSLLCLLLCPLTLGCSYVMSVLASATLNTDFHMLFQMINFVFSGKKLRHGTSEPCSEGGAFILHPIIAGVLLTHRESKGHPTT